MQLRVPWTSLRAIGNSQAVKLTILIPIVGYLVLLNENVLHWIALSHQIFGEPESHSFGDEHWRLLFVCFGLTLVAGASSLHQLFCPPEIKQFSTSIEYIGYTRPHLGEAMFDRIRQELTSLPRYEQLTDAYRERRERIGVAASSPEAASARFDTARRDYERDLLDLRFTVLNESNPWARRIAFVLYTLGFVVLSFPTINVLWRVIGVTAAWISQGMS